MNVAVCLALCFLYIFAVLREFRPLAAFRIAHGLAACMVLAGFWNYFI